MTEEAHLCIVCAWRKDCQKKFRKGQGVELKCPDFARDLSIKDTENQDVEKKDSGNN